jgi:hypothetical protein
LKFNIIAKEINAQVPAVGLTIAGQQIGRKRASSVEKNRVESSPLRRGIIVGEIYTYIYNICINLFVT